MKCEGCGAETTGYRLWDYCEHCSKNLCPECMSSGYCAESPDNKHRKNTDCDEPLAEREKGQ